MAKSVVMPQMGESVAEGTIVRWLKKVGDAVERDEPLFEISTDKVDAEIPSPAAGVVSEVKVKEGETVPINTVVAVIDETASKPAAAAPSLRKPPQPQGRARTPPRSPAPLAPLSHLSPHLRGTAILQGVSVPTRLSHPRIATQRTCRTQRTHRTLAPRAPIARRAAAPAPTAPGLAKPWSAAEARELRLSPVVRKIAREHHVDVRNIAGSGDGGRVTKSDILAYIDAGAPVAPAAADAASARQARRQRPLTGSESRGDGRARSFASTSARR